MTRTPLADALLAALPEDRARSLRGGAPLEPRLEALCARAAAAWPEVSLAPEGFVRHLAARIPADGDPSRFLDEVHAGDLYLAYGCSLGDPAALAAFERQLLPPLTGYLRRRGALPASVDDFKQQLRARLLVAESPAPPRIAGYSGRGPLAKWLRVAAARLAINLRAAPQPREDTLPDEMPALDPADADPELAYFRVHYGALVREAIGTALAGLLPRHAAVLRLHFLRGMTMEAIAGALDLSERTVRRAVTEARARILEETRRLLRARLQVTATQLDSIIRVATADLDPSIVRFLTDSPES